jgi:hypothetical protein
MNLAYPMQKLQDWLTQQWVIFRGKRIDPNEISWLMGPFGNLDAIGEDFINQFAEKEGLIIDRGTRTKGLIPSMDQLNLSKAEFSNLARDVIDFYENTADYGLGFSVKWNPFFKVLGVLLNKLFSHRINQLNVPTKNVKDDDSLKSEIIALIDPRSDQVKYTFWLRSVRSSGRIIYTGAYGMTTLPSGRTCIKAVFPLPNGNATVLLSPSVGKNGELILESSGARFGDAGFYFLLKDSKGKYWSQFIRSFRDRLIVSSGHDHILAEQTLTLWHWRVLTFNYKIKPKNK